MASNQPTEEHLRLQERKFVVCMEVSISDFVLSDSDRSRHLVELEIWVLKPMMETDPNLSI